MDLLDTDARSRINEEQRNELAMLIEAAISTAVLSSSSTPPIVLLICRNSCATTPSTTISSPTEHDLGDGRFRPPVGRPIPKAACGRFLPCACV